MNKRSKTVAAIVEALEASKLPRKSICDAAEIDTGHLCNVVNGSKGLSIERLEKLAEVLGLEIVVRKKRSIKRKA